VIAIVFVLAMPGCTTRQAKPEASPQPETVTAAAPKPAAPERRVELPLAGDFDGRTVVGKTMRRHTHTKHGLDPVRDRLHGERIEVSTLRGLVMALGSNRTIVLAPGAYLWGTDDYEGLSKHFGDGIIHDVENLALVGLDDGARILQPDGYQDVLIFHEVRGLTLYNLILGHHDEWGGCAGGVLRINGCRDVVIDGLDMFGSGTEGMTIINAADVEVRNSIVWGCSEQLSSIGNATKVRFVHTDFRDNGPDLLRGFVIEHAEVVFDDVLIAGNHGPSRWRDYGSLFTIDMGMVLSVSRKQQYEPKMKTRVPTHSRVEMRRGEVEGNTFARLSDAPNQLTHDRTFFRDNVFEPER
jgi:hypothetical protein